MGDRANVYFKDGDTGIGLYAHWGGRHMAKAVFGVLSSDAFKRRIGDASYATRIGVQILLESLRSDSRSDTGFGLWTHAGGMPDNDYGNKVTVVDVATGKAYACTSLDDELTESNHIPERATVEEIASLLGAR